MKLLLALLIVALFSVCSCETLGGTRYRTTQPWLDESQTINRQDNERQRWENHRHGEIQPWIPTGLE